jgi:hypothetical protein
MARVGLFEFAFALSVVGALTLIIVNLLLLLRITDVIIPFYSLVPSRYIFPLIIGMSGDFVINIICGAIALAGSQRINSLAWSIILIVASIVAGGIGGALVLIGGVLALIGYFT